MMSNTEEGLAKMERAVRSLLHVRMTIVGILARG